MAQQLNTVGIIAEYNPFHNGHRHQLEEIRRLTGAENILVVMGGNFLQRGNPAFTDKYLRTRIALGCGADFVLELPAVFATASAELFARGAVSLLHQLGCVDGICFGSECGDLSLLSPLADFLCQESEKYSEQLRALLSQGVSYPAAREQVLKAYFPTLFTEHPDLLSSPNNILAIEYLKALRTMNSPMHPLTIPRSDHGYHTQKERGNYLPASALRQRIQAGSDISPFIPGEASRLLREHPNRFPLSWEDFSEYLYCAISSLEEEEALCVSDCSPELWHRILQEFPPYTDLDSWFIRLKSRQYTHSRICRLLCHILLRIRREFPQSPALYGRILGVNREKAPLLRQVRKFPLINKPANAEKIFLTHARRQFSTPGEQENYLRRAKEHWRTDLRAAELYRRALYHKGGALLPEEHLTGVLFSDRI